jgi:hypothetical protein
VPPPPPPSESPFICPPARLPARHGPPARSTRLPAHPTDRPIACLPTHPPAFTPWVCKCVCLASAAAANCRARRRYTWRCARGGWPRRTVSQIEPYKVCQNRTLCELIRRRRNDPGFAAEEARPGGCTSPRTVSDAGNGNATRRRGRRLSWWRCGGSGRPRSGADPSEGFGEDGFGCPLPPPPFPHRVAAGHGSGLPSCGLTTLSRARCRSN